MSYYNEMYEGDSVRDPYARLREWVETMPDDFRQMKQAEAEALFTKLMGDVVEPRREFIQQNALNVENLDT